MTDSAFLMDQVPVVETRHHLIYRTEDGYLLVPISLVSASGDQNLRSPVMLSWREIVGICVAVVTSLDDVIKAALKNRVPASMAIARMWLVPVGQEGTVAHHQNWLRLVRETFGPDAPQVVPVRHPEVRVGEVLLSESGGRYGFVDASGMNPFFGVEELVEAALWVLCDARTHEVARDQYSPFFLPVLTGHGIIQPSTLNVAPEVSNEAAAVTPSPAPTVNLIAPVTETTPARPVSKDDDWEGRLRGHFERTLQRHGL